MALRWNLEAVADHDSVCFLEAPEDEPMRGITKGDRIMNPVTNTLIWATIAVDLPGITYQNADEFFARLRLTEQITGPLLIRAEVDGKRPEGDAAFITPDEVIAHIGMTANVSPLSRAAWLKKLSGDLNRSAVRVRHMLDEARKHSVKV